MTTHRFDPEDLAALRKRLVPANTAPSLKPTTVGKRRPAAVQLNVRVRPETKAQAEKLATERGQSLGDLVECGIALLASRANADRGKS